MFVHLHVHTEFSLVDSLIRIERPARKSSGANVETLTGACAKRGLPAVAVTDRDNLFAMVKFYKLAEGAGVKPIIGADVAVQELGDADAAESITLLVADETGYRNLTRLVSRAYAEGQSRGRPRIQRDWLAAASDGLIALGGRDSEIGRAVVAGRRDAAETATAWWMRHFPDRFYLEVTRCGRPGDEVHLAAALDWAADAGLPVVASNDVRFLERSDFDAHEARVCIAGGRVINDERRPREYSPEQYLKSPEEMAALFADLPEVLENSVEIARRCTLNLRFGDNHLPDYPVPDGVTVTEHLKAEAEAGLERRFERQGAARPVGDYRARLEYELGIIERMGFGGYFLVVADFIRWGKGNGVPVGPGRGSGAGSLVAYALGITDLDPLPYNLLFERFLNPERVSLPDFDVDFCIEGRDRVIAYVAEKYGRERVSQIVTFGSMAARAVVRDVCRVLGHPYGMGDRIAKLIPGAPAFKADAEKAGRSALEHALVEVPELKAVYDAEEEIREILDLGMALEDLTRGVGIHAGGVIIAPKPLTEYSPMFCEAGGAGLRTQFDMKDCETIGLVKFDFLGLRTLTIIESAVQQVNARYPGLNLDVLKLPLDDRDAYRLYADGQTTAVFQMESQGMQRASVDLKPDCFEDIIALISLYRPGPMDLIPQYCRRKHGQEPVSYLHPDMEGVLKPTYGNFVYQEQVMQMAQVLAGYTLGGADLLRRAMGKKKPEEMAKERGKFESGAEARGIDPATASSVFDLMEKFAGYGFNKSHAAAYALVSYQTAWLKAHYPAEFMAAVMSAEMSHTDTVVVMLEECRRMKLVVLPPDVNSSEYRFTVNERGEILYGLGAVKGAGEGAIEGIISERRAGGRYADLFDFCRRIDTKKANRRVLEALIGAGAMDGFQLNRPSLMKTLPKALQLAEQTAASAGAGIADLFGLGGAPEAATAPSVAAEIEPDWEANERLAVEKKVLGLYLSGHPVTAFKAIIDQVCSGTIKALIDENAVPPEFAGAAPAAAADDEDAPPQPVRRRGSRKQVMLAGWLTDIRTIMGERPGKILILDDRTAQLVCWLDFQDWQRFQTLLKPDTLIFATGSINASQREGRELEYRLQARSFYDLDSLMRERAERITLTWRQPSVAVNALPQRLAPFRSPNGATIAVEYWGNAARAVLEWGASWRLKYDTAADAELRRALGSDAVRVDYRRWVAPVSQNQRSRAEYDDGE